MKELESGPLRTFTPCRFTSKEDVLTALTIVHAELVLIHPFRDGNGRAARLLSMLMGLQAGLPPLDFSGIVGRRRRAYFEAVQSAMKRDYEPMKNVFADVIRKTLRGHGRQ